MYIRNIIKEKLREAMASVLPITVIVALLCFALIPMDSGLMLSFLVGAGLLVLGMGFFTLGAEMSMSRIGNLIGAGMTKTRRLWLIVVLSLALGAAVTVAEPDLQVLATYVPGIDKGGTGGCRVPGRGGFSGPLHAEDFVLHFPAPAADFVLCPDFRLGLFYGAGTFVHSL